jgi:hypothetical protein
VSARCELTDLLVDQCAHCTGREGQPTPVDDVTVTICARYGGRCGGCGKPFGEGEQIGHSDDAGGWVRMRCCGGAR